MRVSGRTLAYAVTIEFGLGLLALAGGPHGQLGIFPWLLQLPGILLVLFVSGSGPSWWRVGAMVFVQVLVWYAVLHGAWWVRRRLADRLTGRAA
jgi:hypothetical protein